ncbi:MAG: sodium:solute symporter [Polyangiaceae bacterium]|nr:sodium:solute symporter [Polyangiaceae bacterium]
MDSSHGISLAVFAALFALVTVVGFVAARWRQGDLDQLHEWGLAGRRFGTVVTWFLLGGDLYTAYTFMAVPALVFGAGALGFFAVPYTTIAYPFVFVVMPRLWSVSRVHGYITAADFVRGRFGSRWLALAVAATGILATMPYIALQLVGIQVVLGAMGVGGDLPLVIAFAILAAYTYQSGLRAPALIAVVKDTIIYVTVIAAVVVIPAELGGYAKIFDAVPVKKLILTPPGAHDTGQYAAYATMALGSALALFLYPHSLTGVLSSSGRAVIRRNAAMLPAYSFLLALIALLGYMALAAGVDHDPAFADGFARYGANFAVPALFLREFSPWFVGFAFASIAIGALVPAAIMSIAAANLFTRNLYREYLRPECEGKEEATVAKIVSLVVKFGALAFIVLVPQKYAIQLQLLGGVWVLQTFPAIIGGLYTNRLHRGGLLAGWAVGMGLGTWMAYTLQFKGTLYPLSLAGFTVSGYAALWALLANIAVTLGVGAALETAGVARGDDETAEADYGGL